LRSQKSRASISDAAHERQLHVRVRVDAAGEHELAAGVDDLGVGGDVEVPADRLDDAVPAVDVRDVLVEGGDEGAVADDDAGHGGCPSGQVGLRS
jgi:hypothetical protein